MSVFGVRRCPRQTLGDVRGRSLPRGILSGAGRCYPARTSDARSRAGEKGRGKTKSARRPESCCRDETGDIHPTKNKSSKGTIRRSLPARQKVAELLCTRSRNHFHRGSCSFGHRDIIRYEFDSGLPLRALLRRFSKALPHSAVRSTDRIR